MGRSELSGRYPGGNVPSPGCTCYLPMLAGSGQTVYDTSKEGNDWTLTGGSWLTQASGWDDRIGYAVSLDGVDDYLSIGSGSSIETSEMTVRLRFKYAGWNNNNNEFLMSEPSGSGTPIYLRARNNGTIDLFFGSQNVSFTVADFDPDRIYELTLTLSPDKYCVYIDGALYQQNTGSSVNHSGNDIYIGQRGDGSEFANMEVYSVETYDRALSRAEVKGHHHVARQQLGALQGQTRWFDNSWTNTVSSDPAGKGIIVEDQQNSDKYRIVVDGGTLTTQGPL